jgi:4-amino-4-deoxy-L-arabinose transferase-like glycosyltransferase
VQGSREGPTSLAAPPARTPRTALAWTLLVALFLALRVPGLLVNSTTYDEPIYVGASMHWTALRDARAAAMLYHPPLAYHLIDLPLRFLDVPLRAWDPSGLSTQVGLDALYASTFRGAPVAPETVLLLARIPILLVGALGLPLMFLLGRRLGGATAGWIAAMAWAAFPEAAAQSIQATTDCVAAVAALFLAWTALRHVDAVRGGLPSRRTLVVLGVATGLALLAKHTLLVHVAVTAVALVVMRALSVRRFLAVAGIAAFVVWAGYAFELRPAVADGGRHETLERVAESVGLAPATLERWARSVPLPAPTYLRSVLDALFSKAGARSGTPWTAYMHGTWSETGFWTYFPYAALVKTPLLLLAACALGTFGVSRVLAAHRGAAWLLVALFAVPFAATVASRLNIGFRHLLPTLPFLFVVAAGGIMHLRVDDRARRGLLLAAAFVAIVAPLRIGSDPIPFANVFAGGPAALHRHLADSNLEIGQDLGRVKAWAEEHDARVTAILHTSPGLYERECARDPRLLPFDLSPSGGLIAAIRPEDQRGAVPQDGLLAVGESVLVLPRWRRLIDVAPLAQVGRTRIYALPR